MSIDLSDIVIAGCIGLCTGITINYFHKKFKVYNSSRCYKTAIHESGHVLIYCLNIEEMPTYVCTIASGVSCGHMRHRSMNVNSIRELESVIKVFYGGSAAEELIYGYVDVGSYQDKKQAQYYCEILGEVKNKWMNECDDDFKIKEQLRVYYTKTYCQIQQNIDFLKRLAEEIHKHGMLLGKHIKQVRNKKKVEFSVLDRIKIVYYLWRYIL